MTLIVRKVNPIEKRGQSAIDTNYKQNTIVQNVYLDSLHSYFFVHVIPELVSHNLLLFLC